MIDKKILMEFCEDAVNPNYRLPFSIGDYTYATDGLILIKVPRMAEFPENPQAPNPEITIEFGSLKRWYPVKGIEPPKEKDCEFCHGEGQNFECYECDGNRVVWFNNDYSEYTLNCKSCDGTGKIKLCEECDGTGKTPGSNPMDFNGVTFDQRYLAMLSKLSDCEIGIIGKEATTPFRFDGGNGIIMPMRIEIIWRDVWRDV